MCCCRCHGYGLAGTELAQAQCSTHRLKLLKIGALIRITVRKVWVSLAGGYPYVALFQQIYEKLCAVPLKVLKKKDPEGTLSSLLSTGGKGVRRKQSRRAETSSRQ